MMRTKVGQSTLVFKEAIASIGDEMYEALKTNDTPKLEGLQCLGVLIRNWTRTSSGACLLSYFIRKTNEKNKLNKKLKEDGRKIIPAEFSIAQIKKDNRELGSILAMIDMFQEQGFIEIDNQNPPGFNDLKDYKVSLSKVWDEALDELMRTNNEMSIFSESLGRLIALSGLARQDEACSTRMWRTFYMMFTNLGIKNEIPIAEAEQYFSAMGSGKLHQFLATNNERVSSIRIITCDDGINIKFNQKAINVFNRLVQLSQKRIQEKTRKR